VAEAVLLSDRVIVMTPAPGSVAADISIPIQRPRLVDEKALQDLRPYAEQVRRVFAAHGVEPEDQPAA
jgi:NitT/TauT family transport system ATP-binding protein